MDTKDSDAKAIISDPRWSRIVDRDKSADGEFWYTVNTTGIYCRPSCPSRGCNPANVTIHDSLESARETGFRACKRCKPDGPAQDVLNAQIVTRACRLIEQSETAPALGDLAEALSLSPGYFHRVASSQTIANVLTRLPKKEGRLRIPSSTP